MKMSFSDTIHIIHNKCELKLQIFNVSLMEDVGHLIK